MLLENKTLKEKVKKLQGRLDAAVKAKSPTSIVAGKPAAGIVDRELAAEYQMKEFLDGSGIFWYGSQRAICSACTKWEEYVNLVVDIFFPKEVLRVSCARGLNKGRKLKDTVPLCQPIVEAIIGKVCARFQPPPTVAQITGKINQKCTEARRPKRVPLMAMN